MAKIHVLERSGVNQYRVVVHQATPAGNNSAGFSWSAVVIRSGRNTTVMTVGTGAGQTTQAEVDSIVAGTTLEGWFHFQDDPAWTATQRNAALDQVATQVLAELQARFAADLKWYGATRA